MRRCGRYFLGAVMFGALLAAGCAGRPEKVNVDGVKNLSRDGDVFVCGAIEPEGLDALAGMGAATVVDVRQPSEIPEDYSDEVAARGMTYFNVPMASDAMTDAQAADCLAALSRASSSPVVIHCAGGSRAGAVYGLWKSMHGGCDADGAVRLAKQAGMKSDGLERAFRA
jgi:uncharacterized protein (TIGR01244 family)